MKIVVVCEGKTEEALRNGLRDFIQARTETNPRMGLEMRSFHGPVMREKLGAMVKNYDRDEDVAGVVALTDVFPDFDNAKVAIDKLTSAAGDLPQRIRFRAHAAQYDVEAWILPFWNEIAEKLGVKANRPGAKPEEVNNQTPPSFHLKDLFKKAKRRYEKPLEAAKWLTADRLERAAKECPQLRSFLDTLLEFAETPMRKSRRNR